MKRCETCGAEKATASTYGHLCGPCRRAEERADYDYDWSDEDYEDPPLYPVGKLSGMTLAELQRERDAQADRQGRLGDAEHIDDRAVEETEMRWRLVNTEIERRKAAGEAA